MDMCRDRVGLLPVNVFKLWTCSMCYSYLFRDEGILVPNNSIRYPALTTTNGSHAVVPDVANSSAVRSICDGLSGTNCDRWTSCCKSAINCCRRQLSAILLDAADGYCPSTWDGFGCFDATTINTNVFISCPVYIDQAVPTAFASKFCTSNGTWWRDNQTNQEWTDYTTCVQLQNFKTLYYVGVSCNILSLALLLPACIIFLLYRQLRKQHRIKLHLNLFVSFVLTNVFMLLWEHLVYYNRIETPTEETFMHRNTIECKALYLLTRYSWTTNFMWMFLEGFHLHRLIVSAFKVPRSIKAYYLTGWGVPFLPVTLYAITRILRDDKGCWVKHAGGFEWIVYVPNLLCILVNVVFLGCILKILLTQLQSHPNEPSSYRRALKATFVLIPLFGLQLFLIMYRPPADNYWAQIYEVAAKVVTHTQGALIALLFCFFNGEVMSHIRLSLPSCYVEKSRSRSDMARSNSFTTQYIVDTTKTAGTSRRKDTATKIDKKDYILMKSMNMKGHKGQANGNV